MKQPFLGLWRIVEMELWGRDDIDMLGPAHIRFNRNGTGGFQFMAVQGEMDCRFGERDGRPIVEFSWCGSEETDHSCGRGWATLSANDELHGRFFFHLGDDAAFTAMRGREAGKPRARQSA